MTADIKATIRKVKPAMNKLPPVKNQTAIAASAAIGNAKMKPMTTIANTSIMSKTISNTKSDVGSVGMVMPKKSKNSPNL